MEQTVRKNNSEHTVDEAIVNPTIAPEEIAVSVKDVTVTFRSYEQRPTMIKDAVIQFIKTRKLRHYSPFKALNDVSFTVKRGEVFGIIGSNGAGKSTLLRVIAGVLPPTEGESTVNGRVDSLIQLGAGFDRELNAIENIYLNGSLHGKSKKEIQSRVDAILDFAELQEFATTPIKYYSSGMYARLGFAVAADREPDILIVDEVLQVGDERFHNKCKKVFQRYVEQKKTIIMVSHGLSGLKEFAHRIALMSKGRLAYLGDPEVAISKYLDDEHYETALRKSSN